MTLKPIALLLAALLSVSACAKKDADSVPAKDGHAQEEKHDHHSDGGHDDHHGEGKHIEGQVAFSSDAQRQVGLTVEPARLRTVESYLSTTGAMTLNADRQAHVTPRVAGRVLRIAKTVGDTVKAGEVMATIESTELGQAQSAFLEAQARYGPAKATLDRLRRLFQEDLVARKELLAAENQVRLAEIDLEKTRNQLALLGYGPDRINSLVRSRQIDATIPVTAPISGIIIAKHVTLGEQISPGDAEPAFTISDVTDLWVNANLYEKDLAKVNEGQQAVITTPAFPGKTYQGRVSLISTTLDEVTRTAKARIVVANSDRRLKPEMFATIRIKVGQQQALAIPESALVTDKDETFVFVHRAPETFEKRPIQVGEKAGGLYPVTAGLKAGEPVVTAGGFTLKSELLKESFGEHDH